MSKPEKRRPQHGDAHISSLRMRPIAAACAGLLFIASPSHAEEAAAAAEANAVEAKASQDAAVGEATDPVAAASDAAPIETVVVTGLRHSIESSIATKRDSDSIVEVVTAEDIGKLPDVSIAENLARLPGLTAQRVDGRAQSISIRGMGPKYGVTLLNNREIVSTGDSRSFEYDQFPSELLSSAIVYKTPDASLSAMGLSGTVNLKTVRPLEVGERKISLNLRAERAGNGELVDGVNDIGGRFSASYIDQFADGKVGISLGYAHLDNPGQQKYHKTWGWQDAAAYQPDWCGGGCSFSPRPGILPGQIAPTGFETGVKSSERERDAFMAVLEFKPNEKFHSQVDLFYSKFDQMSKQAEMQAYTGFWGGAEYTNTQVNANGVVTAGDVTLPAGLTGNDNFRFINRYNKREDDTFAVGWNNELKLDKWKFDADLSYSRAKRDEYNGELYAQMNVPATVSFSQRGASPVTNLLTPGTVELASMPWETWHEETPDGHAGRASMPHVEDDMKAFQLTASRMFDDSPITSVDFGVKYSDREKKMNRKEDWYLLKGAGSPSVPISPEAAHGGIPMWDYKEALASYYDTLDSNELSPWNVPGRRWSVEEKVTTFFGKVNFDVDMKVPVRGNFGVQAINTDSTSKGSYWSNNKLVPVTKGHEFSEVLPSLNMTFDFGRLISKGLYVRFGAAEEYARPVMDELRAGGEANVNGPPPPYLWSGKGGNPYLEPWRAIAYDLAIEKYFGKRSYLSAAYFHKKLLNPIYSQTTTYDFSGIQLPSNAGGTPLTPIGTYKSPQNGDESGSVRGVEVSASLDAGLWSTALDGFGFIGSVSSTKSNITERGSNLYGDPQSTNTPLEGLSGVVRSLTAYYERNGFSARISQRFRSGSSVMTRDAFGDPSLSVIEPEEIVDLQLGYAIESGAYKGLSFTFQVNNLTDEPYRTAVSSDDGHKMVLPERNEYYGRQYLLGASYKF